MRRFLTWAISFAFSASAVVHAAPIPLKGSDTLEEVTKDVINLCSLSTLINYVGGGSGTGQAAMVAGTQQIAPMSRELNGTACTASAGQLLIGLDGISIITSNQVFGDSVDQTPDPNDDCSDSINGGISLPVPGCVAADGCTTPGTYVFTDWKDVMAVLYGGQNHTAAAQLINRARNPARIDCASAVRQALVNTWALIFNDSLLDPQPCRASTCLRLKHAFRRGDLSGTTDTFVSLVGLVPIPPFTTTTTGLTPTANNLPIPDGSATANPFCNAGTALMSKGDSDYLDLDPIRRIADSGAPPRMGLEQIAQGFVAPSNPPATEFNDDRVEPPVTVLADYTNASEPNILPELSNPNAQTLQKAAITARRGLGTVLVIEMPGNFGDERVAYYSTVALGGEPTLCTTGKYAPSLSDTRHLSQALCPNGRNQPCLLPVNTDVSGVTNFNCLNNTAVPVLPPLKDARVFNLLVVDSGGHYVRDNFVNPNLTIPVTNQNRIVSAFYRLHMSQVTNLGALAVGINCKKFSSTEQIGCLVSASPCSVGFAGREAVDNALNIAMQVAGIKATAANISNLATNGGPIYPLSRRLWVNALNGLAGVTGDEQSLLRCFQGNIPGVPLSDIDLVVRNRNFVPVPAGVARTKTCPATFP